MPWIIAIIFCLAFVFSMLGLGGAILYVPLFYWFGYDFKSVAIPTALFINGVTALSASSYYFRHKMVDFKAGLPMIVTSFIGAPIGAWFTEMVPTGYLMILFSVALVLVGVKMLFATSRKELKPIASGRGHVLMVSVAGLLIGFIAGLLGVGGGFLIVPILIALGYPTKVAAATSAFIVIFPSFSGFAGHIAQGNVDFPLLLEASVAVVIASQLGARFMDQKMDPKWLRRILGVVLLGVAIKLSWGVLLG